MPTSDKSLMDYLAGIDYPTCEGSLHTTEIEVASIIINLNDVGPLWLLMVPNGFQWYFNSG